MPRPGSWRSAGRRGRAPALLLTATLLALTALAYHGVLGAGFVFDDNTYLLDNPDVMGGIGLRGARWALTSFHASNWHPLTWLSHQLDATLFGDSPAGHHAVNLALHLLNTALLLALLRALTGARWPSALVAALFALHPLHVESVAWVSERKDVLSTALALLALLAYRAYAARPVAARLVPVAGLLALAMAAKPMPVTLPFLLLLLDWWPLGRLGPRGVPLTRLLLEKLPLAAVAAALAAIALAAQQAGRSVLPLERHPVPLRLANAALSYAVYLVKTVWPRDLAVFYPLSGERFPAWQVTAAAAALVVLTLLAVRASPRRGWPLTGWLWYLGTLLPVIGLVQVGSQSRADRYTYLPLVGIFLILAWGLRELAQRRPAAGRAAAAGAAPLLALLALLTWRQTAHWSDEEALFGRALAVTRENWIAHYYLGVAARERGEGDAALGHYREALRIQPGFFAAHAALGELLVERGRVDEGIEHYHRALQLRPRTAELHVKWGVAIARRGEVEAAVAHFRKAVRLDPALPEGWANLGTGLSDLGRQEEAFAALARAIVLDPEYAEAYYNQGVVLERMGRSAEAGRRYREALRLDPGHALARTALARVGRAP